MFVGSGQRGEVTRHRLIVGNASAGRAGSLTPDTLGPWSQVAELADAAGMGRNRTAVTLPADWTSACGATLELGQVSDTCPTPYAQELVA